VERDKRRHNRPSVRGGLIYTERRHLLGQHYTETIIVDLILSATLQEPGRTLDPSCGSGTFLVRTLNFWKANYRADYKNLELVEGMDIDKLASMLSKVNLYIQALDTIKEKKQYNPKIYHKDFFKAAQSLSDLRYVVTNPPYTRQEELTLAFYDKDYKKNFDLAVEGIMDWNKRASIYAYFLAGGAKVLKEHGRLGFIVENSWLNTEYGGPLKIWFLKDFSVECVIESLVERWFQDAAIITNIIVCEKTPNPNGVTNFIYLKKTLVELFGAPPPSSDVTANQRYYEKMRSLFAKEKASAVKADYAIRENEDFRIVSVKKNLLETIEKTVGKWGIIKGPKEYFEIVIKFLQGQSVGLKPLDSVVDVDRGITTNANEIFYLPSKFWTYRDETENYLTLKGANYKALKLSKDYLRPLVRLPHIKASPYTVSKLTKKKHEDYVLWVEDTSKVQDHGVCEYLKWAAGFVKQQREEDSARFPTLAGKLDTPSWPQLPNKTNAQFLFKNDMNDNYAIYHNRVQNAQVDKRLFLGNSKVDVDERLIFAVLNSVFTYLGMELMGRTNLGEGALDVNVTDYKLIPIVDPELLKKKLEEEHRLNSFLATVDKVMAKKPMNITSEAKNEDRLKMEQTVLGVLGFTKKDINRFYQDLIMLANLRTSRASSLRKEKSD
jgi:DNA modification methylase